MTVGKICSRSVDLAEPFESVRAAAQRMLARKVGTLVVVDDAQLPVGLITDRDLTVRVLAEGLDPAQTSVEEVMSQDVQVISEDSQIGAAMDVMRGGPFRRLVVVNETGRLVGIISMDDMLEMLASEFSRIRDLLYAESPESLATE